MWISPLSSGCLAKCSSMRALVDADSSLCDLTTRMICLAMLAVGVACRSVVSVVCLSMVESYMVVGDEVPES